MRCVYPLAYTPHKSIFQWVSLHLSSLTRNRRPFFDEMNILETYQPRARTMGHLFIVRLSKDREDVFQTDDIEMPKKEQAVINWLLTRLLGRESMSFFLYV